MIHGKFVEVEPVILKYLPKGVNFYYFCGGRGIGKTYGALDMLNHIAKGELVLNPEIGQNKFLYLRRTSVEADSCTNDVGNCFKKYNVDEGTEYYGEYSKSMGFGEFYDGNGNQVGYSSGLSTFSNLRGIDFSDVVFILFDECVSEKQKGSKIAREGTLMMNMYETINRNRGILGQPEVVVCMLSNAINLGSDLLSELNFTPILNDMILKGQQRYTSYERGLHIEKYVNHVVSTEKENTALYKFAKGTGFEEEALSGNFVNNDMELVRKVPLTEYECLLSLENLYVYKHKSQELYHVSTTPSTPKYVFHVYEREKFREVFYWKYKLLVVDRKCTYDNYQTRVVFESMINFKPLVDI